MFPKGPVKSISSAELRFAMAIFENAALMKTPRGNVEERRVVIVDDDGIEQAYSLGDHQLTRGLTAVLDHYKEQGSAEAERYAVAWRILCIPNLANHPACADWLIEAAEKLVFHDAVIETLAVFPMTYGDEICPEDFFRAVETAASCKAA